MAGAWLLPSWGAHAEVPGEVPIIAFLNSRSGGGMGRVLIEDLRRSLGEHQVFDLALTGKGLRQFCAIPNLRVLVCGGDGTMGWILSCVDQIAMMPLGTGNDLSRTFGWGPGFSARMRRPRWLETIASAQPTEFDRWSLVVRPASPAPEGQLGSLPKSMAVTRAESGGSGGAAVDVGDVAVEGDQAPASAPSGCGDVYEGALCNYFSIGVDSKIALAFHQEREAHPERFTSQLRNFAWYGWFGFREGGACCSTAAPPVASIAKVFVLLPGREEFTLLPLPTNMRGVVASNLRSYSGGRDLWGAGQYETAFAQRCATASVNDGLIELVGIKNVYHMTSLVAMNCCVKGRRLAQCRAVRFELSADAYLQVDGEPWLQSPAVVEISHLGVSAVLQAQ